MRIEDTDQSRTVSGAENKLEEMLNWMGICPDESPLRGGEFGPYRQSERLQLYNESADSLVRSGAAYRCFCSEKRLDLLRKEAARTRSTLRYDGRCRALSEEEILRKLGEEKRFTIRLKLRSGHKQFTDLVYGDTGHDVYSLEGDPIIMKTDGFPTYHLANVVDDHHMKISHVLRGVEWQVSTPKHIMLYEALGWKPPKFGHLPLIMNSDGSKVSKRQGDDINIESLKERTHYQESILNFISLVGGGFEDREHRTDLLYSMTDLQDRFQLSRVTTHSGRMDMELLSKLNRTALKQRFDCKHRIPELISDVRCLLEKDGLDVREIDDDYIASVMLWAQDRIHTLQDLTAPGMRFLWTLPQKLDLPDDIDIAVLHDMIKLIETLPDDMDSAMISTTLRNYCKTSGLNFSRLMKLLRNVFAGSSQGPPVAQIIEIYGKRNAALRLRLGIKLVHENYTSCCICARLRFRSEILVQSSSQTPRKRYNRSLGCTQRRFVASCLWLSSHVDLHGAL